jgi:hypothetical protein
MLRPTCGGEGEIYYQLITSYYLLLKKYDKYNNYSDSIEEYLEHDSYFLHPETIAFLLSYEPKLVVIADEIDSIYQKLLVVFSEKLNIKHDVFEKWAIKAKEMLAVLGIPKATESEAFYEEHDIDGILSDYFDNAWPK